MHLACVVVPRGLGGVGRGGTAHREGACRDAGIACARAESLGVDASGPWVEGRGRVITPRPLGAHVGRVLRLCGLLQGIRLESTLLALARPRDVLVQSSATRGLALALGHRPRALGARLATPFMGKLTCRQRSGSTTHVGVRVSSYAWLGVVLAVRAGRIGHAASPRRLYTAPWVTFGPWPPWPPPWPPPRTNL